MLLIRRSWVRAPEGAMYRGSEPSCSRLYEMYGGIAACQAVAFPREPGIPLLMPNFFYLDKNNQKQGPLTPAQVKTLADKGIITPNTPMMTDTGKRGLAKQLPGLFAAPVLPHRAPKTLTERSTETQSLDCANRSAQSKDCGSVFRSLLHRLPRRCIILPLAAQCRHLHLV